MACEKVNEFGDCVSDGPDPCAEIDDYGACVDRQDLQPPDHGTGSHNG